MGPCCGHEKERKPMITLGIKQNDSHQRNMMDERILSYETPDKLNTTGSFPTLTIENLEAKDA